MRFYFPKKVPRIELQNVLLRKLTNKDIPDIFSYMSDFELIEHTSMIKPTK